MKLPKNRQTFVSVEGDNFYHSLGITEERFGDLMKIFVDTLKENNADSLFCGKIWNNPELTNAEAAALLFKADSLAESLYQNSLK